LVTRRDLPVAAADPERGLILHGLVIQGEGLLNRLSLGERIQTDAEMLRKSRAFVPRYEEFESVSPIEGADCLRLRVFVRGNPVWPIVFDPGSGRLYTSKSDKLLLRPFRPRHYNEIAPIIGLANFEGGTVFQRYQIATLLVAGPASYRGS